MNPLPADAGIPRWCWPRWCWQPLRADMSADTQARAWLATELEWPDPASLPLARDHHGRPRLQGPLADHDCNWSHSGDGLAVAIGRGIDVGIDLERLRPRANALKIAERYFAPAELAWLRAQDDNAPDDGARDAAFLRLWCAKEALLKAHGRGLAFGLDRLAFVERDGALALHTCDAALGAPADWQLRELAPQPGFHAALAWRQRPYTAAR